MVSAMTPKLILSTVADRCRTIRLETNEPQRDLAARAGISVATLKRFEASGHISAEGLIRVLHALRRETGLLEGLKAPGVKPTLKQLIATAKRPRSRARKPKPRPILNPRKMSW